MLENEECLRKYLRDQVSSAPLEGGLQVKKVYLSNCYATHLLRVRGASSLTGGLRDKVNNNLFLSKLDRWTRSINSPLIHSVKQNIKILIEVFRGNYSVLTKGKLERTLRSHRLSDSIKDLVDPYVYLKNIVIKRRYFGVINIPIKLNHTIIKERNDQFVNAELIRLVEEGNLERAKELIFKSVNLDEKLWERHRFNTDLVFLGNMTIRDNSVVLRDLGAITDSRTTAEKFILKSADEHIQYTTQQLSYLNMDDLVDYYKMIAKEIYTIDNFSRLWPK